jgi:aspartate kinase
MLIFAKMIIIIKMFILAVGGFKMGIKVAKFGGTSVADAKQFMKVKAIVQSDEQRCYVVPSAPGRRFSGDEKVTDMLYLCHQQVQNSIPFEQTFDAISERYREIVRELGLTLELESHLSEIRQRIAEGASADYVASRGEYLNGLILAEYLNYDFIDAKDVIRFDENGRYDEELTNEILSERLKKHKRAVIPGFYGSMPDGATKTFSRGGSDITGAIVARAAQAEVYENWTDVSGFMVADPRIVKDTKPIKQITYRELRELSYMGATVLHDEAVFPVRKAGIPIHIKNTNAPEHPGTKIISEPNLSEIRPGSITGIAGKKDFTVIAIYKNRMNSEIGFVRRMLSVLEENRISFEHLPSGIDTVCIVIETSQLNGKLDKVVQGIREACEPDTIDIYPNMALIATVGYGMAYTPGVAARIFTALYKENINIRMIDQGSSEINIIVGIENDVFEKAVQAIYNAFAEFLE